MEAFEAVLASFDDFLWTYVGATLLIGLGLFFTLRFKVGQLTKAPAIGKIFVDALTTKHVKGRGVHPLQAFFTSIGGCIGIGNLVGVCTAVQIGGPGALFWIWMAAFLGMTLKYAEVYLGLKFRVKNSHGGFDGGPMYYLSKAFKSRFIPFLVAFLLCIYGAELYMFRVVSESIATNWNLNMGLVSGLLLLAILYAASGGIERVGKYCTVIIPVFLVLFSGFAGYALLQDLPALGQAFGLVFSSAFSGTAALGGFAGAGIMLTISQGMARGCYSGDIGVGFASVIHAESSTSRPERQAALSIFGIFLDTFVVCTLTVLLIIATGVWNSGDSASLLVQHALSAYFPGMQYFMPVFILLLGYSTMISFLCVGLKCAEFLSKTYGRKLYFVYATLALIGCSFMEAEFALSIMSISGALLLVINGIGIFRLRKEVTFLK